MKRLSRSVLQIIVLLILLLPGLACVLPGLENRPPQTDQTTPVVTILSPAAGQKLQTGVEVKVQSSAVATGGIVRTELVVDGEVVWVDANAQPQPNTPFIVIQPWVPEEPGSHIIQVRAYNGANVAGQSEPLIVEVEAASAQAVAEPATPTVAGLESGETAAPPTPAPPTSAREGVGPATSPPVAATKLVPLPAASTPAGPSPTPTVTPTPGLFAPTGLTPEGRFKDIWQSLGAGRSRLGYPTGPEIDDRNFARQYFETGLMYWWDNPDGPAYIWVIDTPKSDLSGGDSWNRYLDQWDGEDEYACESARNNDSKGPVRGFGQLWCERPELQARLGNPRQAESGSGGSPPYGHVQFYQAGVMLDNPLNNEVFVLFDQGDWLRFGY